MDDLKRNGSGYYDPTAYKAIRKFQNGGVTMEVYRGDIFYIEDNYRTEGSEQRPGRPALVVSNNTGNYHSDIVSIVWLTTAEKKPLQTHCNILSRVPSIAICEQVVTISQNRLGEYVRTATEAEMHEIDRCLMIALGLDLPLVTDVTAVERAKNQELDDLKMKLEGAERELDEVKEKYLNEKRICDSLQRELVETAKELEKEQEANERLRNSKPVNSNPAEVAVLKAQLEIYKQQNEMMLERLIGA